MQYAVVAKEFEEAMADFLVEVGKAKAISEQAKQSQKELQVATDLQGQYEKVSLLFQGVSEVQQAVLINKIERLVSLGLRAVFEEEMTFIINMQTKADQMSATFRLRDETGLETDIMDAKGGGVAVLVGVLLQIVMLTLMRGRLAQVLFLDESFSHVSDVYIPRVSTLMHTLSNKLGLQVVMITHQPEFSEDADVVYRFAKKEGHTVATRVKG